MKGFIKTLLLILIFTSCNTSSEKYIDVSSSENDIEFYDLVKVEFQDGTTKGYISIPNFLIKENPAVENSIFCYYGFDNNTAYTISIDRLKTRNTVKLTDKQYLDITNNETKGDLSEIERILSPTMKNVRVVQFDGNLIINGKYFLKRVSYFQDKNMEETVLQEANCTNFHFVTLHNKTKYSFNINYYGDDKSIAELSALFNTIGGSITFN
jgi:hypothetical protein